LALEKSLTDTQNKTPKKKKKKRSMLVWAVPGNCPKGQIDRHRKQNPQTTKQNKKKRSVLARAVPGNCPDNSSPIGSQAPLITFR
jgi:hypothetical protein